MSVPSRASPEAGKRDCAPERMRGALAAPEHITNITRSWLGTPYRHQMSLKGVGCDCVGLVRGVWREVGGGVVEVPAYSPDWAEVGGLECLIEGLGAWLRPV